MDPLLKSPPAGGAVLLLDEIDLASNKILCLQSILEGKGVFLKKIGKFIAPKDGFQIFATKPTLRERAAKMDDSLVLMCSTELLLERFPRTFEQAYPTPANEIKILQSVSRELRVVAPDFCKRLVDWADIIRKTFYDGGIEEIISTRRLVHIIRAYSIWNNKAKLQLKPGTNRFDDETKQAFLELYDKVDADFEMPIDEEQS